MNQIWVGSDWHLWNTNNNYAHPYRSDTDIKQFIDKIDTLPIQKDDLVLFLGDFADILDPDPYKIQWILDKIPGTKIMVYGNHDIEDMSFWLTAGFDGVADMVTIHHMIFTHFPIHVGEEYINFHGHLHTEKFSQLDARWVNVYNLDMPFTRLDDVLEKIQYNNHIATHTDANIFPFEAKGIKDTIDKYTNVLDLSDEFPLVPQDESVIKNQEDIYYNKEKFDSGEINLCFITGHSGSGKSTMGKDMKKHGVEHCELDEVAQAKEFFTIAQLKKHGGMIYSFFSGPGKRYYDEYDDVPDQDEDAMISYCSRVLPAFVNFAKQYAKAHKDQKFSVEGIWLFYRKMFKPEEFKDYAFYIKGTSMIISDIRAVKRDHANIKSIDVAKRVANPDRLAWYFANERDLSQFVKYFSKLTKQQGLNESIASTLDPNFVSKEPIKLSSLKRVRITKAVIDKYKSTYPDLRHVRCEDTKEYKCDGYIWLDNQGDLVAHVGSCEYNDDHTKWIVSLEVISKFKGHGLAKQILDYATKTMHCKYLSVNKENKLAKSIYDKYGFKVYYENENMYFMTIDPNPQVISESSGSHYDAVKIFDAMSSKDKNWIDGTGRFVAGSDDIIYRHIERGTDPTDLMGFIEIEDNISCPQAKGITGNCNIGVHPDYRGRGIAKAMVKQAIKECKKENPDVSNLIWRVKADNTASQKLAESCDFELVRKTEMQYMYRYEYTPNRDYAYLDNNILNENELYRFMNRKFKIIGEPKLTDKIRDVSSIAKSMRGTSADAARLASAYLTRMGIRNYIICIYLSDEDDNIIYTRWLVGMSYNFTDYMCMDFTSLDNKKEYNNLEVRDGIEGIINWYRSKIITKTLNCPNEMYNSMNKMGYYSYAYYEQDTGTKYSYFINTLHDKFSMNITESQTLNEVLFDDIADTEYWEQDDEYKPGSRKNEPMAEDYDEVKIKSTHEPRRTLKFLKEATDDVVRSLTESYITAPPTDGTADSLVTKPEVPKYRRRLWSKPLYQVSPVDPRVETYEVSGWYSSVGDALEAQFGQDQIYVGEYYLFTLLPGHYDIRAGDDGPYWYFGRFHDEEPKIEISGTIETYSSQEPYYDWVTKYPKGRYVLYNTTSYSAIKKALQNDPFTESADEFGYDSPEVEDDAFGGEEVRFFNQEESYPTSTLDESIDPTKLSLYHVSPKANITTLQPKLSSKPLKGEENTTKRISAAPSIDGCFRAVGYDLKPGESAKYYIYKLLLIKDSEVVKPTKSQVPDQSLGNEYWVLTPTKTKSLGYIEITADSNTGNYNFDDSHALDENQILTLDDPARFMNEATTTATKSSYKKLYPVYINLFSNNTVFGKLIKTVTGSPYTHATIGLDSTMNNMYSFSGIPYNTAPLFLCSGFVRESIWSPAFTRCAFFHTYVTFVDKEGRDKIQKKINNFIKNYDKYDYNTPGLFEYYFGATNTKHHDENKKSMWFCSEFVTACVNASDEVEGFEDIMRSPEDLAHMPNTFDLGEWHVEDFDQKKMDILTKRAEAKFRKNPEMSSSILSEDASGSWIMDESAREKLRAVYKNAQNSGREVYNKMRQHDVHKYVFNLDWKKLHDEFVRLFPKNSPATRFDLIGLILHSYLIPTKQSIENVTENIVNQFKEIKKTVRDGYIKLLDIAKSIIFFWNKKLKDSALKYPSEELITESAGEKYYTEPYSFRDKKYFKVTYNVLTGNTDTYYTDVSQSEDMLDNIIKIQPEDLDKLKIQFARDADELSTILATDYIKDTKLYQRIGSLPISSDFNFSIFSLLRITSVAQWNQEKYMESIRGLIPTDLTEEQFESYLLVRIKQLEEAMRFLTVLILENIALFGFTAADQARILSSGADRKDVKKAKRELDQRLLSNLTTDPKTGSVTYSLTSFGLGEIVISKNVYDENKDWLKPSRYLVRSANYDYIIAAHGHADNQDRWEIDPVTINGKVYRYVDQLVHGLTKLGSSRVLITCCNPNDYQLAEQFASIDGIEYCNANVIMESVATTQYPSQLSKITDIELRKSIKAINVWRKNLLNLLDERFDFICRMDVMTLDLSDDLSTVRLTTHSNTKPNNIKHLYASTINEILSLYGELLSAMRVLVNQHTVNEGSYQVNVEKYGIDKKSNYPMISAQRTLAEAIHEARIQVLANYRQYSSGMDTQVVITESGNTVKSFPLYDIGNDRYLDPELHADLPADYEGLTEAATQKLYPVYVLLSHRSASVLSNAIKALTHSQFSHAALSFDPKLTHMYSFGRNSPNSSKGSFRLESIKKDAYTMGEVPYSLYVVPCTAEQCKLIKKRLKYFAANKSNFTFDMAGLVKNGLGIESEPDDKWFCSRFVADVLNAGAPNGTKYVEHPSLMDPDDFRHTNFAQYVCGGLISDYDYLVAERITKDILHSAADVRSQVGHLKNENTNMIIPSYIKYHNQIWHYKYANDPEDINYPDD